MAVDVDTPFSRVDDFHFDTGTDHGLRVMRFEFGRQARFDEHVDEMNQLSLVTNGVMTAESGGTHWVVPSTRALWIPSGTAHSVGVTKMSVLYCAYFPPQITPAYLDRTLLIEATPLVHGLIQHLATTDLSLQDAWDARSVLFRTLTPLASDGVELPMPTSSHARAVATALVDFPDDRRQLAHWARALAVSTKTIQRAFSSETGMSFTEWRVQAKLHHSLRLLAGGAPVARVARECGYTDSSAYTKAFRRRFGTSPREHAMPRIPG